MPTSLAVTALGALAGRSDEAESIYSDLIFKALHEAARMKLEALMDESKYVYQSDFAKKHQSIGRVEGRVEGRAQAILTVLEARAVQVSAAERERDPGLHGPGSARRVDPARGHGSLG